MKVELFCVTYAKDLPFFRYLVASIDSFARGFSGLTVVVPTANFREFHEAFPTLKIGPYDEIALKGMIQHEAEILRADHWCRGADFIVHIDSDCMFNQTVSPEDYIVEGKPVLWRDSFDAFRESYPTRYGWKKTIMDATGIDCQWDCMCRMPIVHRPEVYALARQIISKHTGQRFYDYILSCKNDFPQTFAEFPTLGAVAIDRLAEAYSFVDNRSTDGVTPIGEKVTQFWSHSGITPQIRQQAESILNS